MEPSSKDLHFFCPRKAQATGSRQESAGWSPQCQLPHPTVRPCQILPTASPRPSSFPEQQDLRSAFTGKDSEKRPQRSSKLPEPMAVQVMRRNKETASAPQPGDGMSQGHFPMTHQAQWWSSHPVSVFCTRNERLEYVATPDSAGVMPQ